MDSSLKVIVLCLFRYSAMVFVLPVKVRKYGYEKYGYTYIHDKTNCVHKWVVIELRVGPKYGNLVH